MFHKLFQLTHQNKPFRNLVKLILLGSLCILAAQFLLKISILNVPLTIRKVIIKGLYCGIIYYTIRTIFLAFADPAKNEPSSHTKNPVESKEFNPDQTTRNIRRVFTRFEDWIELENGLNIPDID